VIVYKSMARGHSQRVAAEATMDDQPTRFSFPLTLKPFIDGGWYWYDVVAGDADGLVSAAEWAGEAPADPAGDGPVVVAVQTLNRPDYVAKLLTQIGEADELQPYLDTVLVMEQGTDLMRDSEFFPAAEKTLGDRLRVIEQGNLGGSGGYARGQLESVRKG